MSAITLRHHATTTAAFAVVFWVLTAIAVSAADQFFAGSVIAKLLVIVVMAYAYMRVAAPEATIEQAMFVGIAWAALSIVVEMIAATRLSHGWFALIGGPGRPALRGALLMAWIGSPALFARSRS